MEDFPLFLLNDLEGLEKRLFDVFNSEYEKVLTNRRGITYEGAFQEATRSFSERHGFIAYPSHDTFRKVRSYKRKKR